METLLRLHSAYKNCRFVNCRCVEPGYKKGHISAVVRAIDSKFASKVHRTMHKRNTVLTRKKFLPTFGTFSSRGRSHIPMYIRVHVHTCSYVLRYG